MRLSFQIAMFLPALAAVLAGCTGPNPAYMAASTAPPPPPADARDVLDDAKDALDMIGGTSDAPPVDAAPDTPSIDAAPDAPSIDAAAPDLTPVSSTGLVLHWRFDEPTGTQALDSSPSGLHGFDDGATPPVHAPEGAPTRFSNPRSRRFQVALNHGVRLSQAAAALRPTTGLTVSVWFRTSQRVRADLVCNGADYFIRFAAPEVEFVRRRPAGGPDGHVTATGDAPAAFDGAWHHAAGVATPTSTAMFIDGQRVARDSSSVPFTYLSGSVNVGRNASAALNFEGWLDDVRIYARALSDDEVKSLAAGAP